MTALLPVAPLIPPYLYGTIVCMKKTFHLDGTLLEQAKAACGASTDTETIRLGLEALIRRAAYQRLAALGGSEPNARDVPRRREKPTAAKSQPASSSRRRKIA